MKALLVLTISLSVIFQITGQTAQAEENCAEWTARLENMLRTTSAIDSPPQMLVAGMAADTCAQDLAEQEKPALSAIKELCESHLRADNSRYSLVRNQVCIFDGINFIKSARTFRGKTSSDQ